MTDDRKKHICTFWLNNPFNSDNTEFVCVRVKDDLFVFISVLDLNAYVENMTLES